MDWEKEAEREGERKRKRKREREKETGSDGKRRSERELSFEVVGVYLFLPFGLGPSPGRKDRGVKKLIRLVFLAFPSLRPVYFASDL